MMNFEDELSRIERTLWRNDVELYAKAFLPDAVLVFLETGRIDLAFALDAIRAENAAGHQWAEVDFQEVRALAPAPDVGVLLYSVAARWNYETDAVKALCATLYVRRDSVWRIAFHQQTAA